MPTPASACATCSQLGPLIDALHALVAVLQQQMPLTQGAPKGRVSLGRYIGAKDVAEQMGVSMSTAYVLLRRAGGGRRSTGAPVRVSVAAWEEFCKQTFPVRELTPSKHSRIRPVAARTKRTASPASSVPPIPSVRAGGVARETQAMAARGSAKGEGAPLVVPIKPGKLQARPADTVGTRPPRVGSLQESLASFALPPMPSPRVHRRPKA